MCLGLRDLLVVATLGACLVWACQAEAAARHAGHPGQALVVQVTDECAHAPESGSGLVADACCPRSEAVGASTLAATDDGATCAQGHCAWCGAVPVREGAAAIPPPVREEAMAETHLRPGRCTAPETPPPIA